MSACVFPSFFCWLLRKGGKKGDEKGCKKNAFNVTLVVWEVLEHFIGIHEIKKKNFFLFGSPKIVGFLSLNWSFFFFFFLLPCALKAKEKKMKQIFSPDSNKNRRRFPDGTLGSHERVTNMETCKMEHATS